MCGRFELNETPARLRARFDLSGDLFLPERREFAPTNLAPIVRSLDGERRLSLARWGLIPSWAKDSAIASHTFNARAETLREKASFRAAFRKRRCLVPVSAFFEWRAVEGLKKKTKLRISGADGEPMALAGLWEWHPGFEGGAEIESFTVITTEPNDVLAPIHNRMPAILSSDDWGIWLGQESNPELLQMLLKPCPAGDLKIELA